MTKDHGGWQADKTLVYNVTLGIKSLPQFFEENKIYWNLNVYYLEIVKINVERFKITIVFKVTNQ